MSVSSGQCFFMMTHSQKAGLVRHSRGRERNSRPQGACKNAACQNATKRLKSNSTALRDDSPNRGMARRRLVAENPIDRGNSASRSRNLKISLVGGWRVLTTCRLPAALELSSCSASWSHVSAILDGGKQRSLSSARFSHRDRLLGVLLTLHWLSLTSFPSQMSAPTTVGPTQRSLRGESKCSQLGHWKVCNS